MINYYEILQVEIQAKPNEIRRAFRQMAKKCHPDLNRKNQKEAEEHFRRIRDAFDTLINPETRKGYDHKLRITQSREEISYPEILRKKKDDPQAQSRLILHHLLNENHEEAVRIFEEQVRMEAGFSLQFYLDEKDWLDGEFLLGEAYEKIGNWRKALYYYESVYHAEGEAPIRFFLDEVKERIRDIYCKKIARRCNPLEAIDIYHKVMEMGFSKKTQAYLYKKIAEAYFKAKQPEKAVSFLKHAFKLEPKLKGAQKICEKLGISYKPENHQSTSVVAGG